MVALGMILGYQLDQSNDRYDFIESIATVEDEPIIGSVEEVIRFLESKYFDSLDREHLTDLALHAVIDNLDPHSNYISPHDVEFVNEQISGIYTGVGIETYIFEEELYVSKVVENGPAAEAGIKPFDRLVYLNDLDSLASNFDKIGGLIQESAKINVGAIRDGEEINFELSPRPFDVASCTACVNLIDDIGYIKIARFSERTYKEFMTCLEGLVEEKSVKHLVLDVRGNLGGLLPEVAKILCQLFPQKGQLLMYTEGYNQAKEEYRTTGKAFFNIDKVAVLIDESSASGAEILAGVIQDLDRGVVIGKRSYGKGLVQEQYDLKNDGAIRLTVAKYYLPTGRSIQCAYNDSSYDLGINDRLQEGELFETNYDELLVGKDTFYTKLLEREVFGNSGIIPDIFVGDESVMYTQKMVNLEGDLLQFAFDLCLRQEITKNKLLQEADLSSMLMRYVQQFEESQEGAFSQEELKVLSHELFAHLSRFVLDPNTAVKMSISLDRELHLAKSQLKKESVLDF